MFYIYNVADGCYGNRASGRQHCNRKPLLFEFEVDAVLKCSVPIKIICSVYMNLFYTLVWKTVQIQIL
jgi:hypothetical protein